MIAASTGILKCKIFHAFVWVRGNQSQVEFLPMPFHTSSVYNQVETLMKNVTQETGNFFGSGSVSALDPRQSSVGLSVRTQEWSHTPGESVCIQQAAKQTRTRPKVPVWANKDRHETTSIVSGLEQERSSNYGFRI